MTTIMPLVALATLPMYSYTDSVATFTLNLRRHILEGPTIVLVVAHSGTYFGYFHQCAAAEGIARAARKRQLSEQMYRGNRVFKKEIL